MFIMEKQNLEGSEGLTRCFIALELPQEAVESIKNIQKLIKNKNFLIGKFIDPENLHLTIKFLGEISEEKIKNIRTGLKKINFKKFEGSLGGIGVFSRKFLKIIWLKLLGKGVFELQKEVDGSLSEIFHPELRFMSHITIARVKRTTDKTALLNYLKNLKTPKMKFLIKNFLLMKSELNPQGPTYTILERYKLTE